MEKKFTVVTQLHEKNNKEIISYAESEFALYGKAKREAFYAMRADELFNRSKYNTYLQKKYNITKRFANSVILDAKTTLNSLKELKEYELQQIQSKISYLETNLIPALEAKRDKNSAKLREKQDPKLIQVQRNLRKRIVSKKNKLNHLKQTKGNLEYQIKNHKYKVCFGTKHLLQTNDKKFIEKRDNQISFVGSKEETSGNQLFQLSYNEKNHQFMIKLRREHIKSGESKYVYGKVYFPYGKKEIRDILKSKNSPLSYRIIKKEGRYYLTCTFEISYEKSDLITCFESGVIGLDFNKGFICLVETNQYGDLVKIDSYRYRFGQGNKTRSDLEQVANQIVKRAIQTQKSIVCENLNFNRTKARTERKQNLKYNQMLHTLPYRIFLESMEQCAYRHQVEVIKVNPAWTSWKAEKVYCPRMKLNIHTGASYVIARKGQKLKI